jgi:hypothetical protein
MKGTIEGALWLIPTVTILVQANLQREKSQPKSR